MERRARKWDELVRDQISPGDELIEPARLSGSVLREPATVAMIEAAEARLGVPLPPSYRLFLAVSNGAYADADGAIAASTVAMTRSTPPGLGFLPVEQVEPLSTADPVLFEVWTEQVGSLGGPIRDDGDEVADFGALTRGSLLIGSAAEGASVLVRATRAVEWQLWSFHKETVTGYKSFGSWLRTMAYSLPLSGLPDALARYDAGDERMGRRIVRVRDPKAVPILVDALRNGFKARGLIVKALGSIGTADAAMALEPFLAARAEAAKRGDAPGDAYYEGWHAQHVLATIKAPAAADILAQYGLHHELAARHDPRAIPLALNDLTPPHFHGASSLRLFGDPTYLPQLQAIDRREASPAGWSGIVLARHQLGDETTVPLLEEIAANPDPDYPGRVNARILLGLDPWPEGE
jgi:hypothetical protein